AARKLFVCSVSAVKAKTRIVIAELLRRKPERDVRGRKADPFELEESAPVPAEKRIRVYRHVRQVHCNLHEAPGLQTETSVPNNAVNPRRPDIVVAQKFRTPQIRPDGKTVVMNRERVSGVNKLWQFVIVPVVPIID